MNQKRKSRKFALGAALAAAAAGFVLRLIQRRVSLGADGTHSARMMWPLVLLAAAVLGFAVWTARGVKPRRKFYVNQQPTLALPAVLLAALLLAAASLIRLIVTPGWNRLLLGCGGLFGAVCMGLFTLQTMQRKRPSPLLYMGLTLSLLLKLIPEFRAWSADPIISDYCFRLFAMLCVLCLSFHLGGFSMDAGKRRISVFYCIAGLCFCLIAAADGGAVDALTYLAYALFLGAELWELMTRARRRRPRPAQPAE